MTEAERAGYEIKVGPDGLLYDSRGRLVHTLPDGSEGQSSDWMLVADPSGERYYAAKKIRFLFQHSSFLAGGPVSVAALIIVDRGRLLHWVNHSGHYAPSEEHMWQGVANFRRLGVSFEGVGLVRGV